MSHAEHFLSTTAWSPERVERCLELALELKAGVEVGRLEGRVLGMVFFNSSLRTRTSFEVGMFQLGGHAVNLSVGQGMWDLETADGVVMDGAKAEHVREAVPVLSRYVDLLGVRAFPRGEDWAVDRTDPVLSAFAAHSEVPVISMESGLWHPCQALADAMTWKEQGLFAGDKVVITWADHPRALPMAVPNSALLVAAQRGLDVTIMRPEPYALAPEVMDEARRVAAGTGGSVTETSELAALEGARIVYAKSWGSLEAYGDAEAEAALRARYSGWQVSAEWMARTDRGRFMHCLPIRRNVVASDAVLDSEASLVVDQAENRLHVQKALMLMLLGVVQ